MIQAPRIRPAGQPARASAQTLSAALVRRRRPLMLAPPSAYLRMPVAPVEAEPARGSRWQDDLRFFLACYAAGLIFFLIMLS